MLRRKVPETLAADFTINGQGESFTMKAVFRNKNRKAIEELVAKNNAEANNDFELANRRTVTQLIQSLDGEEVTEQMIEDLEQDWPGFITGFMIQYHAMRQVEVVKN